MLTVHRSGIGPNRVTLVCVPGVWLPYHSKG